MPSLKRLLVYTRVKRQRRRFEFYLLQGKDSTTQLQIGGQWDHFVGPFGLWAWWSGYVQCIAGIYGLGQVYTSGRHVSQNGGARKVMVTLQRERWGQV